MVQFAALSFCAAGWHRRSSARMVSEARQHESTRTLPHLKFTGFFFPAGCEVLHQIRMKSLKRRGRGEGLERSWPPNGLMVDEASPRERRDANQRPLGIGCLR